jgi:hypothetical protein
VIPQGILKGWVVMNLTSTAGAFLALEVIAELHGSASMLGVQILWPNPCKSRHTIPNTHDNRC